MADSRPQVLDESPNLMTAHQHGDKIRAVGQYRIDAAFGPSLAEVVFD
jgi:hypothetical protein